MNKNKTKRTKCTAISHHFYHNTINSKKKDTSKKVFFMNDIFNHFLQIHKRFSTKRLRALNENKRQDPPSQISNQSQTQIELIIMLDYDAKKKCYIFFHKN